MAEAVDHKRVFRLAYAVLALAFWLSLAGFVVLLARPNHSKSVAWWSWRPSASRISLLVSCLSWPCS